jgi:23S rRNA (uracil1939-C5)-methyltransferase
VMVSCNPATFARDARLLSDAGFHCHWIQPIDQFLWSPHLELVAAFTRP